MISKIGNVLQLLTILSASSVIILQIIFYKAGRQVGTRLVLRFFYFSCSLPLLTFLLLVYGFVVLDFSLQNVFLNSSTLKPLLFKIAASWASHEGSILLWFALLSCMNAVNIYCAVGSKAIVHCQILIAAIISLMFASFIYFTSNPFSPLPFAPSQGLGLNPILQDIALAIHPPILYLGYVSYVVPFTIACSILFNPTEENISLLRKAKIFGNLGLLAMTLGIGFGSWWAYRELGWGGFWFFDPVENISLMPWLSAIALHHSLLVTLKSKRLVFMTLSLAILTFTLSIMGAFLVRSGLLTSVHSFASSSIRAIYILVIFVLITLPSLVLLLVRGDKVIKNLQLFGSGLSVRQKSIIGANVLWLASLLVMVVATLYPVIYSLWGGKTIALDINYFTSTFIPLIIPLLLLAALVVERNYYITAMLFLISIIASFFISYDWLSRAVVAAAAFLALQTICWLVFRLSCKRMLTSKKAAMVAGHLGFALLAFSITINVSLQQESEFVGRIGEKVSTESFVISLQDIKFARSSNYYRQIAEFWVEDKTHTITVLKPENRLYIVEKSLTQESDVYSYLTHDLYAVLNRIEGEEIVHAKIYYRPMISFIWLSIIIMAGGFLISLLTKFPAVKSCCQRTG